MHSNDLFNIGSGMGMILVALLIILVVFLLGREVVCWYWKVNERIALMRETNTLLASIETQLKQTGRAAPAAHVSAAASPSAPAPAPRTGASMAPTVSTSLTCPGCKSPVKLMDKFCENCGQSLK